MVNECILVQTVIFILSGSHLGALPFQGSDSAKTDTSPSGSPLKCQNFGCRVQSSPFLPRKKLGTWGVSSRPWCYAKRRDYGERVPQNFLPALMQLVLSFSWDAGAFQLVPGFLEKGNSLCIVVEEVCPLVEGKSEAFSSAILLMSNTNSFLNNINDLTK